MLKDHADLIASELSEGTGASVALSIVASGVRSGLDIWFQDLEKRHGPIVELRPHGLRAHRVQLRFGNFSKQILKQISEAPTEDIQLARSLVTSIGGEANVEISGQNLECWTIDDGRFTIEATLRHETTAEGGDAIVATCREVIVPIMAAMAELIGYDQIVPEGTPGELEGALSLALVRRRERNPRNRLLCLRLHGYRCNCCGLDPQVKYGSAGKVLEVHHLQPVSQLSDEKRYNPKTDLVPLCPNCHRAVHTRRPTPYSIEELTSMMGANVH
ncbi:HNH endonuclease [Tropicimonas sp. TH_r6]|uniref:HNH endonuclease n=1 Tax=Tropicimonas sp. TH_r6 TaxID=3082085 RepID=UPI0029545AE9|nr:HNH endonuclease [Tropicimonas sp. TH_r6]MDV7141765.1 HNH endonuclease [Tropicimonas sp. TH_r6]